MIKEIDKPEEPPQIAVKFANMVFALGIVFSILLVFYATYKIYNPPEPVSPELYIISMLCGGVFAALFDLGTKKLCIKNSMEEENLLLKYLNLTLLFKVFINLKD